MAEVENSQDEGLTSYRLQTNAYINRPDTVSLNYPGADLGFGRTVSDMYGHIDATSNAFSHYVTRPKGVVTAYPNNENQPGLKSVVRLPSIVIKDAASSASQSPPPPPQATPIISHFPENTHDHLYTNQPLQPQLTTPKVTSLHPIQKARSPTSRKDPLASSSAIPSNKGKRRRFSFENDQSKLAMKMTLPCSSGCCYCVYTSLLGPVKVYFTRADTPKKGPFLGGIKDGYGRAAIPASRKSDVRGLVYDSKNHSLHPPARGQRPLFQEARQVKKGKPPVQTNIRTKNR